MRQVVLYRDREDPAWWVAEVPSLPGCVSQGESKEIALRNIRQAIEQWVEVAREEGMRVPDETFDVQVCVV